MKKILKCLVDTMMMRDYMVESLDTGLVSPSK